MGPRFDMFENGCACRQELVPLLGNSHFLVSLLLQVQATKDGVFKRRDLLKKGDPSKHGTCEVCRPSRDAIYTRGLNMLTFCHRLNGIRWIV